MKLTLSSVGSSTLGAVTAVVMLGVLAAACISYNNNVVQATDVSVLTPALILQDTVQVDYEPQATFVALSSAERFGEGIQQVLVGKKDQTGNSTPQHFLALVLGDREVRKDEVVRLARVSYKFNGVPLVPWATIIK